MAWSWSTLALYTVALALAFGWRTVVHWRRTGDTGLRLDAGPPGTIRWWAKLLFAAALLLGFAGPIAGIVGVPVLTHNLLVRMAGVLLALAGLAATLIAQLAMGPSWRIGVDPDEHTPLVTTGPFAVVRNPIFTAMALTSLGLTLMLSNAVAVVAWLTLVASIQLQVRAVEEPYLLRVQGTPYGTYARTVGRFLPYLGRL
ncbi:methyltransferase family protein [Asanoa iriomotensis]|uniref:Protein-S-isoprenylcysteine O-methyltransferase Ste14 n=1 Tax=Asanoa iriomotensis TaxID=234613 RepID=A0ABQ4CD41_9ACTN|nr:isoprenylcysteine carboxylmethyltransferase family protein [Asanoa iriomotensis]GIF60680.1 hypothetical protein Air01nite_67750 [Asanoa iriomotensis]